MQGFCQTCWAIKNIFRWKKMDKNDRRELESEYERTKKPTLRKTIGIALRIGRIGYCPQCYLDALESYVTDHGDMDDFEQEVNLR